MAREAKPTVTRKRPVRGTAGRRDILTVEGKEPGYVYRIVNDTPGRVADLKSRGYELATGDETFSSTLDEATTIGSVKSKHVGGGVNAVLMRIPQEWYDEDQKMKQEHIDKIEQKTKSAASDIKGGYGKVDIT